MSTFGHSPTPAAAYSFTSGVNEIDSIKYPLSENGTVSSMSAMFASAVSGAKFRLAIYSVGGDGKPGTLLGYTQEYNGNLTVNGTVTLDMTTPLSLTAGDYYLTFHNGGTTPMLRADNYSPTSTTYWKGSITYSSGCPSTFPSSPSGSNYPLQIWATYSTAVASAAKPNVCVIT